MVSEIFDEAAWDPVAGFDFGDITYHRAKDQGTVRVPRPSTSSTTHSNTPGSRPTSAA